ncbi:hypothetical protein D3C78_1784300 [compost metagenome]
MHSRALAKATFCWQPSSAAPIATPKPHEKPMHTRANPSISHTLSLSLSPSPCQAQSNASTASR